MALTTNEKQLSNRILNQMDSEKRRRLRKLTDTLEEAGGVPETPGLDYKYKFIGQSSNAGVNTFGVGITAIGSASSSPIAATNLATRQAALVWSGSAATTSIGGFYSPSTFGADLFLNTALEGGGFSASFVFSGEGFTVATARMFCGYISRSTTITDVNPSTLISLFGVGFDAADTQLQLIHNDGSGTATKVALGSAFPKPSADASVLYRLQLSSLGGSSVSYTIRELISGASASGVITTDLPASTSPLGPCGYVSAGGTSTTSRFRLVNFTEIQPNVW